MDLSLRSRRALVCGSTQGIGRAAAVELALLGAEVTLFARDPARLETVASELPTPHDQRHSWLAADFADPDSVSRAVRSAVGGTTGPGGAGGGAAGGGSGGSYHILVNNTGGPPGGTAADATPDQYLAAFRTHLVTNQVLVQALLPGFKAERYGRVINIISTSVKAPIPGLGVSNTIRGSVASWAKTLAHELAPFGITVNNVLPGFTDTARLAELFKGRAAKTGKPYDQILADAIGTIPAGRLGMPEEVGAAIAFLATPAAAYINGINLPVDGGRTQSL